MSSEDNKQAAKDGYEAFGKGDAEEAMKNVSDDAEWVVAGDSAVAGSYKGKGEIGGFWGKLAEKGFTTTPNEFIAEGDKVVALTTDTVGVDTVDVASVLTFDADGKVVRFETFGDEHLLDGAFPK